jgi:DNA invertase Pin-like site-specific DNA recombinase
VRAVLYLRVSTSDQTTENQLPALRQIAAARGFEVVDEIHETMSGSKKARPGLQRLLQGAHRGAYQVVLVWALDRLGRTMTGVVETVQEFDRLGCRVISHQEQWLDVDGPIRPLLISIFAWVAEMERARNIERTKTGIATARARGKSLGRPKVQLDIDRAFRLHHKEGLSIAATAKKLGVGVGTLHRALAKAG